ncbi:MAG: response regulator transcription factor [Clostridia bacterium]|nr:response regulator transcription factor [Clostridia bacterium]MBO5440726.1 response regulator transcription factor [Clostridia bacterium]
MRILIVEDEKRLAEALCQILTEQKYMVDTVYDGRDGYDYAKSGIYDVIILDIMLPYMDGYEVLSKLRKDKVSSAIMLLTAKDTVSDKVKGLDLGADDYMTKPFSTEELLARVRMLSRRRGEIVLNTIEYGDIVLNIDTSELSCTKTEKTVRLIYKEARLLELFLSRPEIITSKDEIIVKIWGYDSNAGDNNVEAYISFLRKKLNFVGCKTEIISIKKLGYRLAKRD